jgi:hypothetical protein
MSAQVLTHSTQKKGVKLNALIVLRFREDPSSNKYKQLTPQKGNRKISVEIHPNALYRV